MNSECDYNIKSSSRYHQSESCTKLNYVYTSRQCDEYFEYLDELRRIIFGRNYQMSSETSFISHAESIHYHTQSGRTLVYQIENASDYGIKLAPTPSRIETLITDTYIAEEHVLAHLETSEIISPKQCHQHQSVVEESMNNHMQSFSEVVDTNKEIQNSSEMTFIDNSTQYPSSIEKGQSDYDFYNYETHFEDGDNLSEEVQENIALHEDFEKVLEETDSVFEELNDDSVDMKCSISDDKVRRIVGIVNRHGERNNSSCSEQMDLIDPEVDFNSITLTDLLSHGVSSNYEVDDYDKEMIYNFSDFLLPSIFNNLTHVATSSVDPPRNYDNSVTPVQSGETTPIPSVENAIDYTHHDQPETSENNMLVNMIEDYLKMVREASLELDQSVGRETSQEVVTGFTPSSSFSEDLNFEETNDLGIEKSEGDTGKPEIGKAETEIKSEKDLEEKLSKPLEKVEFLPVAPRKSSVEEWKSITLRNELGEDSKNFLTPETELNGTKNKSLEVSGSNFLENGKANEDDQKTTPDEETDESKSSSDLVKEEHKNQLAFSSKLSTDFEINSADITFGKNKLESLTAYEQNKLIAKAVRENKFLLNGQTTIEQSVDNYEVESVDSKDTHAELFLPEIERLTRTVDVKKVQFSEDTADQSQDYSLPEIEHSLDELTAQIGDDIPHQQVKEHNGSAGQTLHLPAIIREDDAEEFGKNEKNSPVLDGNDLSDNSENVTDGIASDNICTVLEEPEIVYQSVLSYQQPHGSSIVNSIIQIDLFGPEGFGYTAQAHKEAELITENESYPALNEFSETLSIKDSSKSLVPASSKTGSCLAEQGQTEIYSKNDEIVETILNSLISQVVEDNMEIVNECAEDAEKFAEQGDAASCNLQFPTEVMEYIEDITEEEVTDVMEDMLRVVMQYHEDLTLEKPIIDDVTFTVKTLMSLLTNSSEDFPPHLEISVSTEEYENQANSDSKQQNDDEPYNTSSLLVDPEVANENQTNDRFEFALNSRCTEMQTELVNRIEKKNQSVFEVIEKMLDALESEELQCSESCFLTDDQKDYESISSNSANNVTDTEVAETLDVLVNAVCDHFLNDTGNKILEEDEEEKTSEFSGFKKNEEETHVKSIEDEVSSILMSLLAGVDSFRNNLETETVYPKPLSVKPNEEIAILNEHGIGKLSRDIEIVLECLIQSVCFPKVIEIAELLIKNDYGTVLDDGNNENISSGEDVESILNELVDRIICNQNDETLNRPVYQEQVENGYDLGKQTIETLNDSGFEDVQTEGISRESFPDGRMELDELDSIESNHVDGTGLEQPIDDEEPVTIESTERTPKSEDVSHKQPSQDDERTILNNHINKNVFTGESAPLLTDSSSIHFVPCIQYEENSNRDVSNDSSYFKSDDVETNLPNEEIRFETAEKLESRFNKGFTLEFLLDKEKNDDGSISFPITDLHSSGLTGVCCRFDNYVEALMEETCQRAIFEAAEQVSKKLSKSEPPVHDTSNDCETTSQFETPFSEPSVFMTPESTIKHDGMLGMNLLCSENYTVEHLHVNAQQTETERQPTENPYAGSEFSEMAETADNFSELSGNQFGTETEFREDYQFDMLDSAHSSEYAPCTGPAEAETTRRKWLGPCDASFQDLDDNQNYNGVSSAHRIGSDPLFVNPFLNEFQENNDEEELVFSELYSPQSAEQESNVTLELADVFLPLRSDTSMHTRTMVNEISENRSCDDVEENKIQNSNEDRTSKHEVESTPTPSTNFTRVELDTHSLHVIDSNRSEIIPELSALNENVGNLVPTNSSLNLPGETTSTESSLKSLEQPSTSLVLKEVSHFLSTACVAAMIFISPSENASPSFNPDIIEDASKYFSNEPNIEDDNI
uniref:FYVE-type domain-containing protein n=1 Tax=Caenorhabditis tropicalis TaxID=1561998 RepID=A0A1I7TCZ2_9PELO